MTKLWKHGSDPSMSRFPMSVNGTWVLLGTQGAVSVLVGPAADQFDRITVLCCVVLCGSVPSLLMSLMVPSSKVARQPTCRLTMS